MLGLVFVGSCWLCFWKSLWFVCLVYGVGCWLELFVWCCFGYLLRFDSWCFWCWMLLCCRVLDSLFWISFFWWLVYVFFGKFGVCSLGIGLLVWWIVLCFLLCCWLVCLLYVRVSFGYCWMSSLGWFCLGFRFGCWLGSRGWEWVFVEFVC